MKTHYYLFVLSLLAGSFSADAQLTSVVQDSTKADIYYITINGDTVRDCKKFEWPEFRGGIDSMRGFIIRNLVFPPKERDMNIIGRAELVFVVDYYGMVSKATIRKPTSPGFYLEAMRIAKIMPLWKSGTCNGENISVQYVLPLAFNLEGGVMSDQVPALFSEDHKALQDFITKNFNKDVKRENRLSGGIIEVVFTVNKKGKAQVSYLLDSSYAPAVAAEFQRVFALMPKWRPASFKGKKVDMEYVFPFNL